MTITTYIGVNATPSPAETVSGDPLTQRNAFVAAITTAATETFESFAANTQPPLTIWTSGSLTLVAAPNASGHRTRTLTGNGRFNTTGTGDTTPVAGVWWECTQDFIFTFPEAHNAFGCYLTDTGDFGGTMTAVPQINGVDQAAITLPPPEIIGTNGSMMFFGVTNSVASYTSMKFTITQDTGNPSLFDILGFDDIIIGDLSGGGGGGVTLPPGLGDHEMMIFRPLTAASQLIYASTAAAVAPVQISTGNANAAMITNPSTVPIYWAIGSSSIQAAAPTTSTPGLGQCALPGWQRPYLVPPSNTLNWISAVTTSGVASPGLHLTPGMADN